MYGNISFLLSPTVPPRPCSGPGMRALSIPLNSARKALGKQRLSEEIQKAVEAYRIDLIVLAGYLSIFTEEFSAAWRGKMINIHPALLPRFGGKGMYGHHVHEAVIAAGETESGCTVHFVGEGVDKGEIILQARVPVFEGDTAESLAARVLEEEHKALPRGDSAGDERKPIASFLMITPIRIFRSGVLFVCGERP